METEILFEEVQQFAGKPVRDFLKVLLGIILAAVIVNLVLQKGVMTDFNLVLITILPFLIIVNIILASKLIMQIRTDGIYVRFPPWQSPFSKFYWTEISEVYIREYNALREYFGWGLRVSPRGISYIVGGNTGIQIIFRNSNKVLISTQRQEEVNEILKRIGKL